MTVSALRGAVVSSMRMTAVETGRRPVEPGLRGTVVASSRRAICLVLPEGLEGDLSERVPWLRSEGLAHVLRMGLRWLLFEGLRPL